MEQRLIDANALYMELSQEAAHRISQSDGSRFDTGRTNGIICARDSIKSAPTIEPVKWISVSERLPENETSVLICATRKFENREIQIVSKAIHTDGKHSTETSSLGWDSGDMDWERDEAADADIIPEGWWEDANYLEQFAAVDDFVTHWMPLPDPPRKDDEA